mmetsp:Transcript_17544/g.48505  ORF Transcript_17544/g.48505 Transcript_17544/m.48505 type:complete len:115 (-) Transcript_17544:132-476(-)
MDHSADGLSQAHPDKLGRLILGRSRCRRLTKEETSAYGGTEMRQLHGCRLWLEPRKGAKARASAVAMKRDSADTEAGMSPPPDWDANGLVELVLLTWSQVSQTRLQLMSLPVHK